MGGGGPQSDSFFTTQGISVNEIRPNNPAKELIIGDNESSIRAMGGRVINYAHTVFHGRFSKTTSLTTMTEVAGLRTFMERTYDRSNILFQWNLHISSSYYQIAGDIFFAKSSTAASLEPNDSPTFSTLTGAQGTAAGTRPVSAFNTINYVKGSTNTVYSIFNESGSYLADAATLGTDSNSRFILATIGIRGYNDSYPVHINRNHNDGDAYYHTVPISTFTMFEIAYND